MRRRRLSNYELETVINFNKEEKLASIFTYEKTWQQHLEKRLGLKPVNNNDYGGKEYQIDKKRIPMPRAPRVLSEETKRKYAENLRKGRRGKVLSTLRMDTRANETKRAGNKTRV